MWGSSVCSLGRRRSLHSSLLVASPRALPAAILLARPPADAAALCHGSFSHFQGAHPSVPSFPCSQLPTFPFSQLTSPYSSLTTIFPDVNRNAPVATLYEHAIRNEGAVISSSGALINFSGKKTGRSPKDKRIVYEETSKDDVWWGPVNIKMECVLPPLLYLSYQLSS